MFKDFENWCPLKSKLNEGKRPNFSAGEIWWCHMGANIGDEQDGKGQGFVRPVLVFKKLSGSIFVGIPLSSRIKQNYLYCNFTFKDEQQSAIIGQIKVFDSKRLGERLGRLGKNEFNKIKEELKKLLF